MKVPKQPTHHGVVLFTQIDEDGKGFGFLQPAGADGSRNQNVYFSTFVTHGEVFEKGDEVDFVLSVTTRRQGLSAHRVTLRKRAVERNDRDAITYVGGGD
jgi:cold shock CspA family protein